MAANEALEAVKAVQDQIAQLRREAEAHNHRVWVAQAVAHVMVKLSALERSAPKELNDAYHAVNDLRNGVPAEGAIGQAASVIKDALEEARQTYGAVGRNSYEERRFAEHVKTLASRCKDALERARKETT